MATENAIEVRLTESGEFEMIGEPEMWEDVRDNVTCILHSAPLYGWTGYNRVYAVKCFFGGHRRYFVAE